VAFAIDTGTEFGRRALDRLGRETIGWLVTVSPVGNPVPSPVWFLWLNGEALIYSRPDTQKLRNIAANPRTALHLDSARDGDDVVMLAGRSRLGGDPPADRVTAYIEKYGAHIERLGWTPATFAADYSVPIRFAPNRLRGL
jgi:PPOX class probable F420-dependent enzyme